MAISIMFFSSHFREEWEDLGQSDEELELYDHENFIESDNDLTAEGEQSLREKEKTLSHISQRGRLIKLPLY
jgi:hypothetical protein